MAVHWPYRLREPPPAEVHLLRPSLLRMPIPHPSVVDTQIHARRTEDGEENFKLYDGVRLASCKGLYSEAAHSVDVYVHSI